MAQEVPQCINHLAKVNPNSECGLAVRNALSELQSHSFNLVTVEEFN